MALDIVNRYVKELVPGTTPTNDTGWKDYPVITDSFGKNPQTVTDDSVIQDGMPRSASIVNMAYPGSINCNLIAGFYDDLIAAAFGSAWATDVLKMGTTVDGFSFEKEFQYLTSGNTFIVHSGMAVDTMTIQFTFPGLIQINFTFVGMGATESTTTAVGGTGSTAPVGAYDVMNSAAGVTGVEVGGVAIPADAIIRAYTFSVSRNLTVVDGVGTPVGPKEIADRGMFNITGTFDLYHTEASQLWYEMIGDDAQFLDLKLTLGDGSSTYTIDTPKLRLTGGGNPDQQGGNTRSMINLPFTGLYDGVDTIATITRVP